MVSEAKCKIVKNFPAVASLIFKNGDYINRMNELGLTLLFYGFDLIALADSRNPASRTSSDQPASIVLELVPEVGHLIPDTKRYSRGYCDLPLLLKSLKNWDWSSEGRHTLHIQYDDVNIELNIAVYTLIRDIGRGATPANARLVVENKDGTAESAICYGREDPSLHLTCVLVDEFYIYRGTIGGRSVCRVITKDEGVKCLCSLEERLSDYESTRKNPKQDFEPLESDILHESDNSFSGLPQLEGPISHSDAQNRHISAWRHVVRDGAAFSGLMRATETEAQSARKKVPERNFFLAGLGVQALYNGDWKLKEVCHVIFGWSPNVQGPILNRNNFDIANTTSLSCTASSPFICLHARSQNMNWVVGAKNLNSYVENKNGSLTIPILYLRDTDYLIREAAVEYKHNENRYCGPRHTYSFTANGLTIAMTGLDEESGPWHERSNSQNT